MPEIARGVTVTMPGPKQSLWDAAQYPSTPTPARVSSWRRAPARGSSDLAESSCAQAMQGIARKASSAAVRTMAGFPLIDPSSGSG